MELSWYRACLVHGGLIQPRHQFASAHQVHGVLLGVPIVEGTDWLISQSHEKILQIV